MKLGAEGGAGEMDARVDSCRATFMPTADALWVLLLLFDKGEVASSSGWQPANADDNLTRAVYFNMLAVKATMTLFRKTRAAGAQVRATGNSSFIANSERRVDCCRSGMAVMLSIRLGIGLPDTMSRSYAELRGTREFVPPRYEAT